MAMTFNISKYIVALAVVSMTVASCSREEDHIWEQSAAERLDAARSADLEILCAATNGWEMLYFTESDFRGVNFLLKFADNGSVTVATRNADTGNAYQEETSAYDVITDDGPVLSFNTYNSLLHRYADPDPDQTQQTDGVGEGGDYEFKIMSISSDLRENVRYFNPAIVAYSCRRQAFLDFQCHCSGLRPFESYASGCVQKLCDRPSDGFRARRRRCTHRD